MYLQNSNFKMIIHICIANKDHFLSLINIRFNAFFIRYKNICSTANDPKILDILLISNPSFFKDNCIFKTLCGKFLLHIV